MLGVVGACELLWCVCLLDVSSSSPANLILEKRHWDHHQTPLPMDSPPLPPSLPM